MTAGEEYLNLVMFLYDVSRLESRNLLSGGARSMSLLDRKFLFVSTSLLWWDRAEVMAGEEYFKPLLFLYDVLWLETSGFFLPYVLLPGFCLSLY